MKPYEWMVKFTPQTEWVQGPGVFLLLAFYSGGLGGGLYLISLYFGSFPGMVLGWLIVLVLKGGFHMAFLGHPERFWRMITRVRTSWISRGLVVVGAFLLLAGLQLALSYGGGDGESRLVLGLTVGAALMAFCTVIYTGFVLNYVQAIPFWNSALLPVLFVLYSLLGGLGLFMAVALASGAPGLAAAERMSSLLLVAVALLLAVHLVGATHQRGAGRASVRRLLVGDAAPFFWIGLVLLGFAVPLGVGLLHQTGWNIGPGVLISAVLSELVGGLAFRYCVLKAALYNPLVASVEYG